MKRIEPNFSLSLPLIFSGLAWGLFLTALMGPVSAYTLSSSSLFEQFRRADDIQEKKTSLEKLRALEPNSAYGHFANGWLFNFERRFDEAIREYKEAIRISLDFPEAHNGLGNVYFNQNKPDQALAEYRAAVFLDPACIEAHLNIAILHYQKNRLDLAASSYLSVIQINPKHAVAQNNLGNIYYRQGAIAKAIRAYQRSLKINPNLPETHFNLAIALEEFDQPVEALKEYRTFLRLAKNAYPMKTDQSRARIEELIVETSRLKL